MTFVCALSGGREGIRVHSSQVPALTSRWDRAMEGGLPQCGILTLTLIPSIHLSVHNTSFTDTSNSIQDLSQ